MYPNKVVFALLSISLLFFSNCGFEDEPNIEDESSFESYIKEEMEFEEIPALSSLIFKGSTILQEEYHGLSSIEDNIALENNHLFLLASVSKMITATALLQLYDQGRFKLDDPINDYLPFAVNVPNQQEAITFKMLLTHTSGIADGSAIDDQYFYGKDSPVTLRSFLENYLSPSGEFYNTIENFYDFAPSSVHEYSNEGNALIGLLAEIISEIPFDEHCEKIFSLH